MYINQPMQFNVRFRIANNVQARVKYLAKPRVTSLPSYLGWLTHLTSFLFITGFRIQIPQSLLHMAEGIGSR